jgi:hypothetical protein
MGMAPGSIRRTANLAILFLFFILAIAGIFIVVGLLGIFLLPITLVALFLLAIYLSGGAGMSGTTIIAGILIFFGLGLGIHFVLGSTIGYVDQTAVTSTLSAVKLASVGSGISDQTFSMLLGFVAIFIVVALAMFGLFVSARKHR